LHNTSNYNRAVKGVGLRPLAYWDCGFESHRGHGRLSVASVVCLVRYRCLRRADHSSTGVLPTVVRRCVWSRNVVYEEALAHWGLPRQKQRNKLVITNLLLQWILPDAVNTVECSWRWAKTSPGTCTDDLLTYLLTPWSRVILEKLTSKLCS